MAYQITDGAGSIKISNNGLVKYVRKPSVIEISVIRGSVVKILSENLSEAIYINHADVLYPPSFSADRLAEILNNWIETVIWV